MSQATVVSWLVVRELWMSFRLFVLLVVTVLAGALVALLPAALPDVMSRLAVGLGVAAAVGGCVAAWSIATERRRGRTGWLIARAVPRATYLSGWFGALGVVVLAGHTIAALLGWLAATGVALRLDAPAFVVAAAATLAGAMAALALGVLVGTLLPAPAAALLTAIVAGGLAGLAVSGLVPPTWVPGAGAFLALSAYREGPASLGAPLVTAGVALAATAVLLGLARIALERAEL